MTTEKQSTAEIAHLTCSKKHVTGSERAGRGVLGMNWFTVVVTSVDCEKKEQTIVSPPVHQT